MAKVLRYPAPPIPGTIVGPNEFGEHLVVVGTHDGETVMRFATTEDVVASLGRDPQSVTELRMRGG